MQNKRNGGYTLVEILVAIAILGIAVLGIGGFFLSASRSYSNVNSETSLQYEAQLTLNQIENTLIDSALGVSYNYVTSTDEALSGYHFVNQDDPTLGAAVSKALYVFNVNENDHSKLDVLLMKWVAADKAIYYKVLQEQNSGREVKQIDISGTSGWDLLAEDIIEFSTDLSDYENTKKVHLNLGIANRYKEYHTTGTVLLRNDVLINEPMISKLYEHITLLMKSEITGVELKANSNITIPGGIIQLYPKVKGTGYPNQTIHQWLVATDSTFSNIIYDSKVEYATLPKTHVDGNTQTLYVTDEKEGIPESLYVRAVVKTIKLKADGTEEDVTYTSDVRVDVKIISDIEVNVSADTSKKYNENLKEVTFAETSLAAQRANVQNVPTMRLQHKNEVQMNAVVSASGSITAVEKAISWSIHSMDSGIVASIDPTGLLKVGEYSRTGSFVVRATLKMERSVYVDYNVRVVTEYGSKDELKITTTKSSLNRGGHLDCSLALNGVPVNNKDYNWTVTVMNSQGQHITGKPVTINAEGKVYVSYELAYDYGYDVWIKAELKTNPNVFQSIKVTIPKVALILTTTSNYAVMGATLDGFNCKATGLEEYDIDWTMAKELNPNYFFTAWGNFNITGSKKSDGSSNAKVVMGSSSDPLTSCTVKATLKNNSNFTAETRIETSDVTLKFTGGSVVSRNSQLQLKVSLSESNKNFAISNETVNWEIANIKINGALKPELIDENISVENGLLKLTKDFASEYNKNEVKITVRAWEEKHGLNKTCVVTVPYLKLANVNTTRGVATGNLGKLTLSTTDAKVSTAAGNAEWEIVSIKAGTTTLYNQTTSNELPAGISISSSGLNLANNFAIAYFNKNLEIVVKATIDEFGLDATATTTIPAVTITPSGKFVMQEGFGTNCSNTVQIKCNGVAVTWQICDSQGNPLDSYPFDFNQDTGQLTIKDTAKTDDYGIYKVRAVMPDNAGYLEIPIRYGFFLQSEIQTDLNSRKVTVKTVTENNVKYEHNFQTVQSDYSSIVGSRRVWYVQDTVYKTPADAAKSLDRVDYYVFISTKTDKNDGSNWYLYKDGQWVSSGAPGGWASGCFNNAKK